VGEEKAKLRVERKVDRPLRRVMLGIAAPPPNWWHRGPSRTGGTAGSTPSCVCCWIFPGKSEEKVL